VGWFLGGGLVVAKISVNGWRMTVVVCAIASNSRFLTRLEKAAGSE